MGRLLGDCYVRDADWQLIEWVRIARPENYMTVLPRTISEASEWLRDGRITSLDLTEALLAKAEAAQDSLAAFITIAHESALAAAMKADAELASGHTTGPPPGTSVRGTEHID